MWQIIISTFNATPLSISLKYPAKSTTQKDFLQKHQIIIQQPGLLTIYKSFFQTHLDYDVIKTRLIICHFVKIWNL